MGVAGSGCRHRRVRATAHRAHRLPPAPPRWTLRWRCCRPTGRSWACHRCRAARRSMPPGRARGDHHHRGTDAHPLAGGRPANRGALTPHANHIHGVMTPTTPRVRVAPRCPWEHRDGSPPRAPRRPPMRLAQLAPERWDSRLGCSTWSRTVRLPALPVTLELGGKSVKYDLLRRQSPSRRSGFGQRRFSANARQVCSGGTRPRCTVVSVLASR